MSQLTTNKLTDHLAYLMQHETLTMNSENHKLKSIPLKWFTNLRNTFNIIKAKDIYMVTICYKLTYKKLSYHKENSVSAMHFSL